MTPPLFSRSGRTGSDGKLHQRLDVPVSEDLHDLTVVAAAKCGVPKAEFVRGLLTDALNDGLWLPLPEQSKRALDVLAAVRDMPRGQFVRALLERVLLDELNMLRSVARDLDMRQSDECPTGHHE